MNKEMLKPCPFCGGTDIEIEGDRDWKRVMCYYPICTNKKCQCVINIFHKTEQEAIDAWNNRKGE